MFTADSYKFFVALIELKIIVLKEKFRGFKVLKFYADEMEPDPTRRTADERSIRVEIINTWA